MRSDARTRSAGLYAALAAWVVCALAPAPASAQGPPMTYEPAEIVAAAGSDHFYVGDRWKTLALRLDRATGELVLIGSYDGGGDLLEMSDDGRFLYQGRSWAFPGPGGPTAVGGVDVWSRDAATGRLTRVGSWAGAGNGSDLADLELSPSGRELYVTDSARDALVTLDRDPATGHIGFRSELRDAPGVSELDGPSGLALSPDGRWAHVALQGRRSGPLTFRREPDGTLTPQGIGCDCVTGAGLELLAGGRWLVSGPIGPYLMSRDPETAALTKASAESSAMSGGDELADGSIVSPDERTFYTVDRWTQRIYQYEIVSDGAVLRRAYSDGRAGAQGISGARAAALSPDGGFMVVSSTGGDNGALAVFSRDHASSGLTFRSIRRGRGDAPPPTVAINDGARYTNDPDVILTVPPGPATFRGLQVSNDGGFRTASALAPRADGRYPWRLQSSGPERLPKTVYVRPLGTGGDTVITDDIVLDERPPTIVSLRSRAARLRIAARDRVSGVGALQVGANRRRPGAWRKYTKRPVVRRKSGKVWVRVRDRAGNKSRWHGVRVKR